MAKREIYARLGVQLRGNRRVLRAERLAPGAFGLYCFCVMDARAELPDQDGVTPSGFVSEEAVLGALSRPADERLAQAEALCSVDLLERVELGFVVVKYPDHNDTWSDVVANRKAAKRRQKKSRGHASVTRDSHSESSERHGDVPISSSLSPAVRNDLTVSRGGDARGGGSVAIDEDLIAWAVGAGAAEPTAALLENYELWIAEKGVAIADKRAGFKRWLKNERKNASRVHPKSSKQPLGSAASAAWADPNRNDGFDLTGTEDK